MATDFLGLSIHLKVDFGGIIGFCQEFNRIGRKHFIAENKEKTVFLENIDLSYVREGMDADGRRFGVGMRFTIGDIDSAVGAIRKFSSAI